VNNTDETLWFDIDCYNYPDSLMWVGNCYDEKVPPQSQKPVCKQVSWEEQLLSNSSDSMKIYVINHDTAMTNDMLTIIENNKFYRKYKLSINELNNLNWIIQYP
jgi:hypothetical protein